MTSSTTASLSTARAAAAGDLLDAMQALVLEYTAMTEADRITHLDSDADRITGTIARHLDVARQQLSAAPRRSVGSDG